MNHLHWVSGRGDIGKYICSTQDPSAVPYWGMRYYRSGRMAALSRDPCTGTHLSGAQPLSDCNTLSPDRSRLQRPLPRVADASHIHCAHSRPTPGHPQAWAHTAHSKRLSAPRQPASSGRRRPIRAELGAAAGESPANPRNHAKWFRSQVGRRTAEARHVARERGGRHPAPPSVGDPGHSAGQAMDPRAGSA